MKLIKNLLILTIPALLFTACATQAPETKSLTEITVLNTGTYEMQSLNGCYYSETDPKKCTVIDSNLKTLAPSDSYNFFIRADEKIRLVFPFDTIQRVGGVVYRPNCHILVEFFAYKEKRYFAEAQITAQYSNPEQGFNCSVKLFEQNLGSDLKTEMKENVITKIRYRVPQRNQKVEGYTSNYDLTL